MKSRSCSRGYYGEGCYRGSWLVRKGEVDWGKGVPGKETRGLGQECGIVGLL